MRIPMIAFALPATRMLSSTPSLAGDCAEIPSLPPLKSAAINESTEANSAIATLLQDAETIYNEGSHIVRSVPTTELQETALERMEDLGHGGESFHIKECNFQDRLFYVKKSLKAILSEAQIQTLIRIEQFDNFIFMAVNHALDCSNAASAFDLRLSRQLLDHGWMEFRGHPEQRDWGPEDWDGPAVSQRCFDDWPHGASFEQIGKMLDDQIEKFDRGNR